MGVAMRIDKKFIPFWGIIKEVEHKFTYLLED
jgi:hypothetical protein